MSPYNHKKIEKKWQRVWKESGLYRTRDSGQRSTVNGQKSYVLDMFPYPSGDGLHVGHPKGYIATDVYSRFKRMQGHNILHPMGWDAFGLPAENYAIKNKMHPAVAVKRNIKRFKTQLEKLGFNYDWSREINTTDPSYYKWTQWIFLQMFHKGLAYRSNEPINWCPSCKTGLANEDLEDGRCERCDSIVEKRAIPQWVLKITSYADRLLGSLDSLSWPEYIKESQRNWIGRSEGVNLTFKVKGMHLTLGMYDSIPQTHMAQTFTIIAPEHPLVKELVEGTPKEQEVLDFVGHVKRKKARGGFDHVSDMEGIFTGRYLEYPPANRALPIWVASYAVYDYGTGIVNCSAHDERDFVFAKKYDIPLHPVLFPADPAHAAKVRSLELFYREPNGLLEEPVPFRGRRWDEAREDIIEYLVNKGWAERKVNYKLRDWVFSRQRYWGEPIPLIHCEKCGVVPVPEKDLPVKLPDVKSYEPTGTGESPLAKIEKWVNVKCPKCGGPAKRETNTMPQWAGSCWYYLAYAMHSKLLPKSKVKGQWSKVLEAKWLPVDMYVGGAEHATRHLIYARFWHKFLFDIGVVSTDEPFQRLQNVGLILASDGRKMSKRFGNVINPDEIVERFGADSLRVYEMFMGPFNQAIAWSTDSLVGARRFLERVWRLKSKVNSQKLKVSDSSFESLLHRTIQKVGEDIEHFRFNTAVSALMILANRMEKEPSITKKAFESFLLLLAPFAPHAAEELWMRLGHARSIHKEGRPAFDQQALEQPTITVVVQVNGKVRGSFETERGKQHEELEKKARALASVAKWISGVSVRKVIVVPDRLVNFVVESREV